MAGEDIDFFLSHYQASAHARQQSRQRPLWSLLALATTARFSHHQHRAAIQWNAQATGGEQVMTLELRLSAMGFSCWFDQKAPSITKETMAAGVQAAKIFLLFLSEGVLTRPFVLYELETARKLGKRMLFVHETDVRHGDFDFAECKLAPGWVGEMMQNNESLPWRRRRFEQDAILNELISNSGLAPPSRASAPDVVTAAAAAVSAGWKGWLPSTPESITRSGV